MFRDPGVLGAGKREQGPANSQLPASASLNECSEVSAGVGNLTIVRPLHSNGQRCNRGVWPEMAFRLSPYLSVDCGRDAEPVS